MTTTEQAPKTALDMEAVRAFELDRDESVMLCCPDCDDLLWLHQDDGVETLGDVIDAVAAHECQGYDPYVRDDAGEPSP